jgi:hypothetical protein
MDAGRLTDGKSYSRNIPLKKHPWHSLFRHFAVALCLMALPVIDHAQSSTRGSSASASLPLDQPQLLPGPRPSAAAIQQWKDRKFGMFIHFGLYSEFGGMYQGKKIDNGYSEQIMANGPIPLDEYAATAAKFNPVNFDPDAIVALAKSAGMKFIAVTSKHHDGFNMFHTAQTNYNVVDATPYHKDVVKLLEQACARAGMKFGAYDQICPLPPSTNSSMPVMKLESSEARNNTALAISSGSPMRPIGMVDTIRAMASVGCPSITGVSVGPGLITFERIWRSLRSEVQVRTKERRAAFVAP